MIKAAVTVYLITMAYILEDHRLFTFREVKLLKHHLENFQIMMKK